MIRINLKNGLSESMRKRAKAELPRLVVGVLAGFVSIALWACNDTNFGGNPPTPPAASGKKTDPNLSPPEDGRGSNPKEGEPLDPKRVVSLQITGLQPEAWWNNCLKIEMNGKTFDIACSKDKSAIGKVVRLPIPDGVDCPVLDLHLETYKNVGETCNERARQGLPCEGPFSKNPDSVRKHSVSAERIHFVLSEGTQSSTSRVIRAFFEDQDGETIRRAKQDASLAEPLGVDFNDAIFELSTLGAPFEIAGAAGTKCPR
ncbi:MAG: hypothetical protein RL189_711 [Pseudomonadota bacterium]